MHVKIHSQHAVYVLYGCLSICLLIFYTMKGIPFSHSIETNLYWQHGFNEQVLAGEIYPRWLFGADDGLGKPVFYFYAPAPFYFMSGIALIVGSENVVLIQNIFNVSLISLSGLCFYSLIKDFCAPKWAIAFSFFYSFLPYHYFDIVVRGAIGESVTYILLPLIVKCILKWRDQPAKKVISVGGLYAALIFSHLPSALLVSFVILIFITFTASTKNKLFACGEALLAGVLGVAISASYIIPALYLRGSTLPEDAWVTSVGEHFVAAKYLLGAEDPESFTRDIHSRLAWVTVFAAFFLIAFFLRTGKAVLHPDLVVRRSLVHGNILIIAISWFMMSILSKPLWDNLPILPQVQFPWRLGVIVDFSASMILPLTINYLLLKLDTLHPRQLGRFSKIASEKTVFPSLALLLFLAIILRVSSGMLSSFSQLSDFKELHPVEYRPRWMVESRQYIGENALTDFKNVKLARALHDSGFNRWRDYINTIPEDPNIRLENTILGAEIMVNGVDDRIYTLKKLYYPHWQLVNLADNSEVTLFSNPDSGLLSFKLASGEYRLRLKGKPLPIERVALMISVISIFCCLGIFFADKISGIRQKVKLGMS